MYKVYNNPHLKDITIDTIMDVYNREGIEVIKFETSEEI